MRERKGTRRDRKRDHLSRFGWVPATAPHYPLMHGPDADARFAATERTLRASAAAKGVWVVKRYGRADDEGAREKRVDL